MIICTIIFLLVTAFALYFIAFGDKLKFGVAVGMMALSAGVICFLVTGFWLPRAFAMSGACFINMMVCLYGEGLLNWKKRTVVTISTMLSLVVAILVLLL